MLHKAMLLSALLMLFVSALAADDQMKPVASLVPDNAIIVLQVPEPKALIDRAFEPKAVEFVKSLPPYKEAIANRETMQGLAFVNFFAQTNELNLQQLLSKLLGGGITIAVGHNESVLAIIESEDAGLLAKAHEAIRLLVQSGNPEAVKSSEYRGVTGWSFGPGEAHAIIGKRLFWANKPEVLKTVLDRNAGEGGAGLAASTAYQAAQNASTGSAQVKLFADLSVLRQVPGVQAALTQNQNPMAWLFFAPFVNVIDDAAWLAAGLRIEHNNMCLEVVTDGKVDPDGPDGFAWPGGPEDGAMPSLVVPRQVAALSFYRDLHRFYAAKDELFPERTSGLIFFENMMGIFFSGRDLTEEVLGETLPDIRVVVAEQEFKDAASKPTLILPGFAAVVRLKNPDKFSLVMKSAWQNAIGLINTTSGQKAQPTLVIETDIHGDTKYTTSRFLFPDGEENNAGDTRFNFQPTLATQGNYLIMSSTEALTHDLIDAIKKEAQQQAKPVAGKHSLAMMESGPLTAILAANRQAMVRQGMVEDGKSREQSEKDVDGILTVMKTLRGLRVDAGADGNQNKLTVTLEYGAAPQ